MLYHHLINIAPAPVLARLKGLHDRMLSGVKVCGRVLVFGGIATAHVSTDEAFTELHPAIAGLQTLFTPLRARRDLSNLVKMCTLFCHNLCSTFLHNLH